jgi:ElaB/YqjD/DUF883 family membrane-anchored ribosome-binding protein
MANGDKTASVESHDALAMLREAMRRFHGTAQDSTTNLRHKAEQSLSEIEQIVQAQQRYVDSLESDASNSDDDEDGGNTAELDAARDRLNESEAAQAEAKSIVAEIESELNQFGTVLNELIPRATDFLDGKLDVLNEKTAIRLDTVRAPGMGMDTANPATNRSSPEAQSPTAPGPINPPDNIPLPDGYQWVPLSEIALATELSGVESPNDFKKVDYPTMQRGLETFRKKVLPTLNSNRGKSVWDLNAMFRNQDAASGISYEHGVQRAFEAFFSHDDAIYLNRGRQDSHFTIINGRHRIKAALDAGWTAIPARTKDLRQ